MKKFFTLILLIFISYITIAQIKVKEGSFRRITNYVMDDKDEHLDGNNMPMALIKISTENINAEERNRLYFKGNRATDFHVVPKIGELYLYISAEAATVLEIKHPDYGKTMFTFPEPLCDFCAYELVVVNNSNYRDDNAPQNTYIIVITDQDDAVIYIDDEYAGMKEATKSVNIGSTHSWRIDCDMYHSESGTLTVEGRETVLVEKQLRPAYGFINVTTEPENGAVVFINNKNVGTTPYSSNKMASGTYNVRVVKEMYKPVEQTVVVTDGNIAETLLSMTANFVNVTVSADEDSDVYIDNEYKGKGSWSGRLYEGPHYAEARKSSHETRSKNFNVALGSGDMYIDIDVLKPICGYIDIVTTPLRADIYIDGKYYGQTPKVISDVVIGDHVLKLEKAGCTPLTKEIVINEGETLTLNEILQIDNENSVTTGKEKDIMVNDNKLSDMDKAVANQIFTVNGVSFTMIAVAGGSFNMGATVKQEEDAYRDEYPVHSVILSDYYVGETEVTQELWDAVMNGNQKKYSGSQRPVDKVSWNDCQQFIRKLNSLTGKNFRLPTEAEWEYAARGGNKSHDYKYSGGDMIGNVAWYGGNRGIQSHNVKTKSPNELGIYDMSGNVYEWCYDWYDSDYYNNSSQQDPQGPSVASQRVLRGGSWSCGARRCRVSDRFHGNPDFRYYDYGFRLAL